NEEHFKQCIQKMSGQESCQQFVSFAKLVGFDKNDEIDLVQYYDQAQVTLVHVKRQGESYPGDYYVMNASGKLMNITQGSAVQGINMMKDLRYPEIISKFAKAQIWSIVDRLPDASTSPSGGLRLIFRFSLLNGCETCDLAGYANVAYDFSNTGILQRVSLL